MYFEPFRDYFKKLADDEMRVLHIFYGHDIPAGSYGLVEQYCSDPRCDCRRVIFTVLCRDSVSVAATVSYGWESKEFYRELWEWASEEDLAEMTGASLAPLAPQSAHAAAICDFISESVLTDPEYVARLKRHYETFKARIRMPRHQSRPSSRRRLRGRR